jgi:hypothetical protein
MSQSIRHFLVTARRILAEICNRGPAEEPISVVNLINDKTGLEDDDVGNHGIVGRIDIFGEIEIFYDVHHFC